MIEFINAIKPLNNIQWYVLVLLVFVAGLFFIYIKFKPENKEVKTKDDEIEGTKRDCIENGKAIANLAGRFDRLEQLSDDRHAAMCDEIGEFKSKVYDNLIKIEHFLGELSERTKPRGK